jgi:LAO/AO transport system kinase
LRGGGEGWRPPVVPCSAVTDGGLDPVWHEVERHRDWLRESGRFEDKRRQQLVDWTRALVRDRLLARLDAPAVRTVMKDVERQVLAEAMTPAQAADRVLRAVDGPS